MKALKQSNVNSLNETLAQNRFTASVTSQAFVLSLSKDQVKQLAHVSNGYTTDIAPLASQALLRKGLVTVRIRDRTELTSHFDSAEIYELSKVGKAVMTLLELSILA